MSGFSEQVAEEALLEWFASLGYAVARGPDIAPGEPGAERTDYREVVLAGRFRDALRRLNPGVPEAALADAERIVLRPEPPSGVLGNRRFHRMLVDGVEVEVASGGRVRGQRVRLVDFDDPSRNDWLAVNQFTVIDRSARRPDVMVFLNGLPIALVELKDPADESATIWSAWQQIQTYKQEIASLLVFNELVVATDGVNARLATLTAPREWYQPWRTIDGDEVAPRTANELEVLTRGVFDRARLLEIIRDFVVFEDERRGVAKKVAGYHQFHATRKAVETTIAAASPHGDRRAGVVWHTQGSGKSLTMVFYAGKLAVAPALRNPTLVVITDRNDLDDQLFGVFARCAELIRQSPVQAADRADLTTRLRESAGGGVIFTTIQKFLPDMTTDTKPLSDRRNIIVIADEAHRSHYGFESGFAARMRHALPNATFVAFTGTPVELEDRDTRSVFGDYIDVYDIARAVEDGATVPISYESRLAKVTLREDQRPKLDEQFEEATEEEEVARRERLKTRWAQLEAIVGTEERLALVAKDLVEHFEARGTGIEGKAMVVAMSRRIAVDLYDQIVRLRPAWHAEGDEDGLIKVVMTGSAADPPEWQGHIRNKARREVLAERFKDPDSGFRVAIVRDMWLTGFDVPSLHTMYVDKPMQGHGLMQAIARVNRVWRDKPGGLVVDYIGLADSLRRALAIYAASGGKGRPVVDQDEAVRALRGRIEVCRDMFHGFDYVTAVRGTPAERMRLLPRAEDHILRIDPENGRARLIAAVRDVSRAFALAVPREEAIALRDEVAFFQAVRAQLAKIAVRERPEAEVEHAIKQIVAEAIAPAGVIDIFEAAGLPKPDISLLSEEFLADVRRLPQKNLAVELLRKLLADEIRIRARKNLVQSRNFGDMLEEAIRRYQARAIETAQVIEELIALAKEMRAAEERGARLGLSDEELAFYDALETNDSAVAVLGDEALRTIAREVTDTIRRNASIDFTIREDVRANLRRLVRRVLRKHGYPPDKQESATRTVLAQAELLGLDLVESGATVVTPPKVLPFRRLERAHVRPFVNALPLYDLAIAAGSFGAAQAPEPEAWVEPLGQRRPAAGEFVARVVGESMNRRIPNGAYCVFRTPVAGSRSGRVLLVQHRGIADPDHGGSYTVKIYRSEKEPADEGWRHSAITLEPDTTSSGYRSIAIAPDGADDLRVIAELVEVLPGSGEG